MGNGVANDVLLNRRFIGDLLKEYGKIAEKNAFCCFEPGIHGMMKNDLPYPIENFARISKMLLKFSKHLFFIEL